MALVALLLSALVGCAADIPESGQDDLRNFFDRTDTDGDGKLSKEELKANIRVSPNLSTHTYATTASEKTNVLILAISAIP